MYKLIINASIFIMLIILPRYWHQVNGRMFSEHDSSHQHATSGVRSAHPIGVLSRFGDSFKFFNLFEIFKDYKSKLPDDNENLVQSDEKSELNKLNTEQQLTSDGGSKADELMFNGLFKRLKNRFDTKDVNSDKSQEKLQRNLISPVVLLPGFGGSRLEARLDKPSVVRYFCDLKTDWEDAWINFKLLLPYMIDCLIDNLRLEFDPTTNTTHNRPGVEIRVKNATQISSVEYLSNQLLTTGFAYFAPIVNKLVDNIGYQREHSIRGAPYDFRKAPNELADYFDELKLTSEQMFEENNQSPITYICHSMGCNNLLYFLKRQTKYWKNKRVKRIISVAAPWGGSLSALRAAAIGDDLGMPYLFSGSKLIQVQRSLPSTIYLFPHPMVFSDVPLIKSHVESAFLDTLQQATNSSINLSSISSRVPAGNTYEAHDFKQFFDDINHPDGYRMWLSTKDLLGSLEAPGVEVWCLVGKGHQTLGRMVYKGEFPSSPGLELYDDGDGTVNLDSANYCRKWAREQKQTVYYKEFNVGHVEMLRDPQVVQYVESILKGETI